jgi:predicted DNA binding protein
VNTYLLFATIVSVMAVTLEFDAPAESFALGRATRAAGPVTVEVERVVPLAGTAAPFLRVDAADHERFEAAVRDHESVESLAFVDEGDGEAVYAARWVEREDDVPSAVRDARGAVLAVRNTAEGDRWFWRTRFVERSALSTFRDVCDDRRIDVDVRRIRDGVRRGTDPTRDLSDGQRAALTIAFRRGYFEVPRRATLSDVADELGISQQAASELVRRATNEVLSQAFPEGGGRR